MALYKTDDIVVFQYQNKSHLEGIAKIEAVDTIDPSCPQYTVLLLEHPTFDKGKKIRLNQKEIIEVKI